MQFKPIPSMPSRQRGASLIEVLVAILLVALGILAMAAMQANASRLSKTNEFRAMGALLASDLADRMRANSRALLTPSTRNAYAFSTDYPTNGDHAVANATKDCSTQDCNPAEMASYDMNAWLTTVVASLPGGWARVSNFDTNDRGVDMWLMWTEAQGTLTSAERAGCPDDMLAAPQPDVPAPTVIPNCMYFRINL